MTQRYPSRLSLYTLPVSTGRVSKMTPVSVNTRVKNDARVDGPWTQVTKMAPMSVTTGVKMSKNDTRVHGPWTRPVDTGTVYRALSAANSVSIAPRLQQYSPIKCTLYPKVIYNVVIAIISKKWRVYWRRSIVADKIVRIREGRTRHSRTEMVAASDLTTARPHDLNTCITNMIVRVICWTFA